MWAKDDPRHAFVMGAKWWHCKASGATAFASEVDQMEREANRRYTLPEAPSPIPQPVREALIEARAAIDRAGQDGISYREAAQLSMKLYNVLMGIGEMPLAMNSGERNG